MCNTIGIGIGTAILINSQLILMIFFFHIFIGMNYDRLLTAVLDALCNPMIKLRNTFPITYSPETETRCKNFSPTENLSITTSMIQAGDSLSHQFPILSELMNFRSHMDGIRFGSWTFREVLDRLLAISAAPVKQTLKVLN